MSNGSWLHRLRAHWLLPIHCAIVLFFKLINLPFIWLFGTASFTRVPKQPVITFVPAMELRTS